MTSVTDDCRTDISTLSTEELYEILSVHYANCKKSGDISAFSLDEKIGLKISSTCLSRSDFSSKLDEPQRVNVACCFGYFAAAMLCNGKVYVRNQILQKLGKKSSLIKSLGNCLPSFPDDYSTLNLLAIISISGTYPSSAYEVAGAKMIQAFFGNTESLPSVNVMPCISAFISKLPADVFESTIFPTIERLLLRSPELVIGMVGEIICATSFKITKSFGNRLCTACGPHLFCTVDVNRSNSCMEIFTHVIRNCDSEESADMVCGYLLSALCGELSDVKLVNSDQRIRCLNLIGSLANKVRTSDLSGRVLKSLKPLIKSESNETVAVELVTCFTKWQVASREPLDADKINFIKACHQAKTSGPLLRAALLYCVISSEDYAALSNSFVDVLVQSFTKTKGQIANPSSATELIVASLASVRLIVFDSKLEGKLNKPLWDGLMDTAVLNQLSNDKFFSSLQPWAMCCLLKCCEVIFTRFPNKLERVCDQFSRPFAYGILSPNEPVYEQTNNSLERILERSSMASQCALKCSDAVPSAFGQFEDGQVGFSNRRHRVFIHVRVNQLCKMFKNHSKEVFCHVNDQLSMTLSLLRVACTQKICNFLTSQSLFHRFVSSFLDDSTGFLETNAEFLMKTVYDQFSPAKMKCIALAVLLKNLEKGDVSYVVNLLISDFAKFSAYTDISKEEVDILNTPEGEICDQHALEAILLESTSGNVKRESKAYSYKDQKLEMELRKEMLAKNKEQGMKKLPQAQQNKVNALLKQESETRERLKNALNDFERDATVAQFLFINHKTSPLMRPYAWRFVSALTPLFHSQLIGQKTSELFMAICSSVFCGANQQAISASLSACYLRTFQSVVELKRPFSELTADEHYLKLSNSLVAVDNLNAGQFSFAFPLLDFLTRDDDGFDRDICGVMMKMMGKRIVTYDPKISASSLPRKEFLELLLFVLVRGYLDENIIVQILNEFCQKNLILDEGKYFEEELAEVLMQMILSDSTVCRRVALKLFNTFGDFISPVHPDLSVEFLSSILIASNDIDDSSRELALNVWTTACESPAILPEFVQPIIREVKQCRTPELREACSAAMASVLKACPILINSVLNELFAIYRSNLPNAPMNDEFGRPIIPSFEEQQVILEQQEIRLSVAACLDKLSALIPTSAIKELFEFLIPTPLADFYEPVRGRMLTAATAMLANQGPAAVDIVLPITENFLKTASPTDASLDPARQATVVLTATVARHLSKDDPRVRQVMQKLTETLSTPSEPVQVAVANSMAPLVRSIAKDELPAVVDNLLKVLFEGESFAERRGAAYGLASIVKGHGIAALKQFEITSRLQTAIEMKKETKSREGALIAHEVMCKILGVIFEPHVIAFLPYLLQSFGDSQQSVRLAADDCAKEIMSKLTGHGIKLVLPMMLDGLKSDQWRTKCASAELLGAMAYCAPRQLSACLPTIVPLLMETINDSHSKVQKGGENALRQIQSVVKNPEVQSISAVIIDALLNPLEKSSACLKTLAGTRFIHRLDAPSLALIMPVIQRALLERHTEPRRCANQLITSVNAQTDTRDFEPYIPSLVPGVKQSLLDPAPDVRMVASKALGALASCSDNSQNEMLPWLLEMLVSDVSSANRSGAAQGLCEVVKVMGAAKLEQLVKEAVGISGRTDIPSATRDGYLLLFVFLPPVFGDDFAHHVVTVIPAILRGLSDESEVVRETALRAGQKIIQLYSEKAQELFVPELERGLINENWRIRYSSVILLSEFLFKVADITGKMTSETADDDDTMGSDKVHQKISQVIGKIMCHRVLAGLYYLRQDIALVVRQASIHAWKLIVPNTPKILREIAPAMLETLFECFSSRSSEKVQIAQRTLADIIRKLADRMLGDVIQFFDRKLIENLRNDSDDSDTCIVKEMRREGVCMALGEITNNANKDNLTVYFKILANPIKMALLDESEEVRTEASKAFSSIHNVVHSQAVTEILNPLCDINNLSEEQTDYALDSLAQIMAMKSRVILPTLLPLLLHPIPNTKALAMISEVAGEAIGRSIGIIIPALVDAVTTTRKNDPDSLERCLTECQSVMLSVEDDDVSRQILTSLLSSAVPDNENRCLSVLALLDVFMEETELEISEHAMAIMKVLLLLCRSTNVSILDATWKALETLVSKRMETEDYLSNMNYLRQVVHSTISNSKPPLPGFVLSKKSVTPILPIYRECLLNGTAEVKEMTANGLEEIVKYSSPDALKSQVINITGPLIRVLGDRFGTDVKTAILGALDALLLSCGHLLKPFIPQLQTTFNKCLIDTQKPIRQKCALAYVGLAKIHMRPENLLTDLTNLVKNNANEPGVRDSILVAIRNCLAALDNGRCPNGGANTLSKCIFETFAASPDITTRLAAAGCIGGLLAVATDDIFKQVMDEYIVNDSLPMNDWVSVHFRIVCMQPLMILKPERVKQMGYFGKLAKLARVGTQSNQILLKNSSIRLCILFIKFDSENQPTELLDPLILILKGGSTEQRELVASMMYHYGKDVATGALKTGPNAKTIAAFVPQLVMGSKEKEMSLRRSCEQALVELLQLRGTSSGLNVLTEVCDCLPAGMSDTLRDLYGTVLRKLAEKDRPNISIQTDETLFE